MNTFLKHVIDAYRPSNSTKKLKPFYRNVYILATIKEKVLVKYFWNLQFSSDINERVS